MFAASELNEGLFTNAPRLAGRPPYIEAAQRRSAEASRACDAATLMRTYVEPIVLGPGWVRSGRPT